MNFIEELTEAKKKFGSKAERIAYFDEVSSGIKKEREAKKRVATAQREGTLEVDLPPFGGGVPYMINEKTQRTDKQINGAAISPGAQAYIDERERTGRKLKESEEDIPTLQRPRSKEAIRASFEKFSNVARQTKTGGN